MSSERTKIYFPINLVKLPLKSFDWLLSSSIEIIRTKFKPKLIHKTYFTHLNNSSRCKCQHVPVIEHKRRNVGAFPEYWLIIPWLWARGVGMLKVIALWNLRRRGSTVTTGETATPRPKSLAVKSGSIGWA